MVDKHFGGWKKHDVPAFTFTPEKPMSAPVSAVVLGPEAEWVDLGWRFDGYAKGVEPMLELIDGILSNGKAGLIDLELKQAQKVLDAYSYANVSTDYAQFNMHGEPKEGQTLEQVQGLLLDQLEALKRGDFEGWLIEAVVNLSLIHI